VEGAILIMQQWQVRLQACALQLTEASDLLDQHNSSNRMLGGVSLVVKHPIALRYGMMLLLPEVQDPSESVLTLKGHVFQSLCSGCCNAVCNANDSKHATNPNKSLTGST
jgi:hypothetical protein